jgi:hypothetical protein
MPTYDLSRDFLDGILLQQPQPRKDGKGEIRAGGQLHFLPSSPDGTMHTAVVSFALMVDDNERPFAQGGWRFLFTSDATADPAKDQGNPFFGNLLVLGAGKIMALLNVLAMQANLPLIPFDPQRMTLQQQPAQGQPPAAPPAQAQAQGAAGAAG